ncbi:thioredoxin family protein [Actinotalea sp. M2MS4P-6]|uniref:thioredoxin family protein n=1 Tax=Actinotalea sp. M2MS4P-6 TaxID=2983762 RepID=UPI0021E48CEA|nr:thioredoxin family protein [Actinotalea sp. M2MS4P-6]MCV2395232.1 thioredoxin family protein [Actinotalea sp. M2MS4P-6]
MKVQLLYFDGCPGWQVAEARLREALATVGSAAAVERVRVETPEAAEALRFHGSPSVLIDGEDPFAPVGATVGLACRLYRTPDGADSAPTVAQLVEALAGRDLSSPAR